MPTRKHEDTPEEPRKSETPEDPPPTITSPEQAQEAGYLGDAEDQAEDLKFPGPKSDPKSAGT